MVTPISSASAVRVSRARPASRPAGSTITVRLFDRHSDQPVDVVGELEPRWRRLRPPRGRAAQPRATPRSTSTSHLPEQPWRVVARKHVDRDGVGRDGLEHRDEDRCDPATTPATRRSRRAPASENGRPAYVSPIIRSSSQRDDRDGDRQEETRHQRHRPQPRRRLVDDVLHVSFDLEAGPGPGLLGPSGAPPSEAQRGRPRSRVGRRSR